MSPKDIRRYWDFVAKFGFQLSCDAMCIDKVKIFLENTELLDSKCFEEDYILQKELFDTDGFEGHKLGIFFNISKTQVCYL